MRNVKCERQVHKARGNSTDVGWSRCHFSVALTEKRIRIDERKFERELAQQPLALAMFMCWLHFENQHSNNLR